MNLMRLKWLWFGISGLIILPGIIALILWHLNLGIDFTGGTLLEERVSGNPPSSQIQKVVTDKGYQVDSISTTSSGTYIIRTKQLTAQQATDITQTLKIKLGTTEQVSFESVGGVISNQLLWGALAALGFASVFIVLYIAWSFRSVPKPYQSWKFGVSAIIALLHDVLVVTGVFAILGHFLNVEVDSLFVTAILTVIGFSVHDTIVVFDRIRENLRRFPQLNFEQVANESLLQTLVRSLSTSFTVVLTLLAVLLLVGPVSDKMMWFVVALLVGIISGTYSSIFNATPLLVLWNRRR